MEHSLEYTIHTYPRSRKLRYFPPFPLKIPVFSAIPVKKAELAEKVELEEKAELAEKAE